MKEREGEENDTGRYDTKVSSLEKQRIELETQKEKQSAKRTNCRLPLAKNPEAQASFG